ncbi:alkaline phosphatase D family protein [Aureibacter tunicatorum]|uniref:PhoD-like phosphatase metallophosphatase domain-containing protein n=1 Tax=Aureibacter tunicatorum TaxID=866807 RepID=A0AAE4BPX1_9BACT|nr:alkaline phosphatase D family protein [Aureibacter tunicatorum]MDR6238449.1 hypothetical protein [Aureibacter tunicatorum]BDD05617.1 hypothetical protein AUTU_31000 [Aureibacter tunicatorum]
MAKKITYPVALHDIAIMGKPSAWTRSWVIKPLSSGYYSLLVFPEGLVSMDTVFRNDFEAAAGEQAPYRYEFTVPEVYRGFKSWKWMAIKWNDSLDEGMLESGELKKPALSELLLNQRGSISGNFELQLDNSKPKVVAWSCNQPFADGENGEAILNTHTEEIFEWYRKHVQAYHPDNIWALGDTAYSDGCSSTNFIEAYYDNTPSLGSERGKLELARAYRRMYRAHWSFAPLQETMRNYPHICVWDDHEIRDGWGSEANDFEKGNRAILEQAQKVANEYILNNGPRVRKPSNKTGTDSEPDAHQAYIDGQMAVFVFDGRSSRKYEDPTGKVISEEQLGDFESFCEEASRNKRVKFLIMGCAVPFINLKDFIEKAASKSPKPVTDLAAGIRDDVRDSWLSPGNVEQFKRLLNVLRKFHRQSPSVQIVNVSGDIHVANLFAFQPMGFSRALYQVTTSALTNREHPSEMLNELVQVGTETFSEELGLVTRIWPTISDPNFLTIEPEGENLKLVLKVFDTELEEGAPREMESLKDQTYFVGMHRHAFSHLV